MHLLHIDKNEAHGRIESTPSEVIYYSLRQYARKDVAEDDILDALVAAVTASRKEEGLLTIPDNPEFDSEGLPMEMVVATCPVSL